MRDSQVLVVPLLLYTDVQFVRDSHVLVVWLLLLALMNSAEKHYLISDKNNDRLQHCPSLHAGSACETVFLGFNRPFHVEVVDGHYLVADYLNNRIQLCPALADKDQLRHS